MKKIFALALAVVWLCAGTSALALVISSDNIELESNPTTGYTWTYRLEGTSVTVEEGEFQPADDDVALAGAGGIQPFTVTWAEAGDSLLVFHYAQEWAEDNLSPTVAYNAICGEDEDLTLQMFMDTRVLALEGEGTGELTVRLDGNITTGFTWSAVSDSDQIEITDAGYEAEESDLTGSGGVQTYTLSGKEAGTYTVTFTYAQEWDEETPPINTILLSVTVDAEGTMTLYQEAE